MRDHDRAPITGSRVDRHGICQCGRIVELSPAPYARHRDHPSGPDYWRHHPQPTSTMIPARVREMHASRSTSR